MQGVPELTYALLRPLGAPKGRVQTFTEVRLQDAADLLVGNRRRRAHGRDENWQGWPYRVAQR